MPNLYRDIPARTDAEFVEHLAGAAGHGARVERIVSRGHRSPDGFWYDQSEDEWVVLLKGGATVAFADGREKRLTPGDHVWIPAHTKHRVAGTLPDEETVWLAVFLRPPA